MKTFIKFPLLIILLLSFSPLFAALEINEIGIHIRNSNSLPIQCALGNSGERIQIGAQSTATTYFGRDGAIHCQPIDPFDSNNDSVAQLKRQVLSGTQLQQRSKNSYVYPRTN